MKKRGKIILVIVLLIGVSIGVFSIITANRINKIPTMSFDEMLNYTTEDNKDAIIAVGTIKNGEIEIVYYGENAAVLEDGDYEFEIGSITKTFTTSLLCKLISQGEINLDDSIDMYLDLAEADYYPTLRALVTHTSGYKGFYLNKQMISNIFDSEGNDFHGIGDEMLKEQIEKHTVENKKYSFTYSNFGISVVGQVITQYLGDDYNNIMTDYIESDLQLMNTRISDGTGSLEGYWNWSDDDAYMPAGAIISTMDDMIDYLSLHMTNDLNYLNLGHGIVEEINATKKQYEKLDIRMDAMGVGWVIDTENDIIWHDGGTSNFNSYIAFDAEKQVGVVILSNLPPDYRIPATVMGVELMESLQER